MPVLLLLQTLFQSTLPREERQILRPQISRFSNFNPRSHERSDTAFRSSVHTAFYFNPRSHERSDDLLPDRRDRISISIHAPTRGATESDT